MSADDRSTLHVGRSWSGHALEDGCPCPKAACGLVIGATVDATCPQHALAGGKTIRQTHAAEQCPARVTAADQTPAQRVVGASGHLWPCTRFYLTATDRDPCTCPDQTPATDSERVEQIRARVEAATEGPWEALDLDYEINGEAINPGSGWWWVWRTASKPHYGGVMEAETDFTIKGDDGRTYHVAGAVGETKIHDGESPQERIDAEFIAHARDDIPWLLALLAEQAATIERVRRIVFEDKDAGEAYVSLADLLVALGSQRTEGQG